MYTDVGDVAGMGSDLFGSFGEASCAALLIGASCLAIEEAGWIAVVFPLYIASAGLPVCLVILTHTLVHIYMYIYKYMYKYIYIYIYICIYIYIYCLSRSACV